MIRLKINGLPRLNKPLQFTNSNPILTMTWTKKHDEFCLVQKLRPSTRLLLRWLLRRSKLNQVSEIEVDLRVFNNWVTKQRGTPYDRKTIREAITQLDEDSRGLVLISRKYSPWVMKLVVRPISLVAGRKLQNQGKNPKIESCKAMYSADHKKSASQQQQQDISTLDSLFRKIGLQYDQNALNRIWRLAGKSMADIVGAIELLLHRHRTQAEPIKNPHGFIVSCLKECWHKGFDLYYQPELPFFESGSAIANFVSQIVKPDQQLRYQT